MRFFSRLGLVWCQTNLGEAESVKVYPNMRRAREMELKALGANSYLAVQRKSVRRGEGREFESMRDYVRGDELRHISWTATARRNKLTTRQYQIERDQTIIIALDAGRLMTGRIGDETKFDTAIHASLALMSAAMRGGDNCGLMVFGRKVKKFLPPKKGIGHIDAVLEALHDLEPELIEPSYSRAFQFISANSKKRSFVVILTDLVDKESFKRIDKFAQTFAPAPSAVSRHNRRPRSKRNGQRNPERYQRSFHSIRRRRNHPPTRIGAQTGRKSRRFGFRRNNANARAAPFGNLFAR